MGAALPVDLVRESLLPSLKEQCAEWSDDGYVSLDELNRIRLEYAERFIAEDHSEDAQAKREVMRAVAARKVLSRNLSKESDQKASLGDRLADKVAAFGGSWKFIGIFAGVIIVWMTVNSAIVMGKKAFDPYPFILLNLVLSCVAAIQAPVIMMSQNRAAQRDRLQADHDYRINLKAELEIKFLNEKVDRMLNDQWKHLLEIQEMQMEMIQELAKEKSSM